jgi:hypothetical protein
VLAYVAGDRPFSRFLRTPCGPTGRIRVTVPLTSYLLPLTSYLLPPTSYLLPPLRASDAHPPGQCVGCWSASTSHREIGVLTVFMTLKAVVGCFGGIPVAEARRATVQALPPVATLILSGEGERGESGREV